MAHTPSTMLALGTSAPAFALPDVVSGKVVSSADFAGRAMVVMFICNHCPFVKHLRDGVAAFGRDYAGQQNATKSGHRGVGIVAISSNDIAAHPEDGPEKMRAEAREAGYVFPYLFDESQEVAKAYRAACTPDFYVFDAAHRLVYRGQFDDSRPVSRRGGNALAVTGRDLRMAVDAVLAGRMPPLEQRPSIGCNIKWKPGNAPAYFSA